MLTLVISWTGLSGGGSGQVGRPGVVRRGGSPGLHQDTSLFIMCGKKEEKKDYSCQKCFKSFSSNQALKTHELTHNGRKDFLCDICDKQFRLKHHLKSHKKMHYYSEKFHCFVPNCSKSYTQKSKLIVHLSRKHSVKTVWMKYISCNPEKLSVVTKPPFMGLCC